MRLLLALLALVLVGVLVLQWQDWPPMERSDGVAPEPAADAEQVGGDPSPLELLDAPVEKDELAVVTERPLFMPDRRPPAEEPEESEEEAPEIVETDLARMDLSAVLITPDERTAWVRDPAKPDLVELHLGDDFEGWTVKEIRSDEVELERQGETDTLVLRDYEHAPAPAPVTRPPQARRRPTARRTRPPPRLGVR